MKVKSRNKEMDKEIERLTRETKAGLQPETEYNQRLRDIIVRHAQATSPKEG